MSEQQQQAMFTELTELEVRRLSSVTALALLGSGAVLAMVGTWVAFGFGYGLLVLGGLLFVMGVLIGRE